MDELLMLLFFFFSSRRRHTRYIGDWSSDVCSSDLIEGADHGFKGADQERAEKLMFAYFDKHLGRAKQRKLLVADHGLNGEVLELEWPDRKSTRLNSSHRCISYAVFCLKKKKGIGDV